MKRVIVQYDGQSYTVAGRGAAELEREIGAAIRSGDPQWMSVNSGQGRYSEARILIAAGIPIALSEVPADEEPIEHSSGPLAVDEVRPPDAQPDHG